MPDLDALAGQIGAELAALVQPMFKRLETETLSRIEAASVRSALIDRDDCLVLTFGDGSTRSLGVVVGRDGAPGQDGEIGAIGPQGATGLDGAEGTPGLDGKDGVDGADGLPGLPGKDGVDGKDGRDGQDAIPSTLALDPERTEHRLAILEGRAITEGLIDRDGALVLLFSDGSRLTVGKIVGRDGVDGRDGKDGTPGQDGEIGPAGLGFDDLDVTLGEDGRTLSLTFSRAGSEKAFEIALPAMIYRGVFSPGREYQPGDTVTFGGSSWVCGSPTSARPGENEGSWTLAVKRGRDGKDFAGPQLKAAV